MTATAPLESSPDIAIIGAGIAGFVFAIACENAGLKYTMYESGPEVWQHGSGIGLASNALRAFGLVDERLPAAINKICKQAEEPIAYRFGQDGKSYKAFETYQHVESEGTATIARSAIMSEMIPYVPEHKIKFSKHLTNVTQLSTGKVELTFRDGSTVTHDVAVGSDGVHSKVRTYVLGKEDPDAKPRFSGKVVYRGVLNTSDVLEIFNEDSIGGVTIFSGRHGHIVLLLTDEGTKITVTAVATRQTWDSDKWILHASPETLMNDFKGWDERLVKMLGKADNTDIWAIFDLPFPRTFVKGNVAVVGDAAHASTPFQGSGTAMAVEDAYFLANLLKHAAQHGERGVRAALQTYDAYRKPRSQKQVHTAMEAGWITDFEHPVLSDDVEAIKELLKTRLHWLWHIDLKGDLNKAIADMEMNLK